MSPYAVLQCNSCLQSRSRQACPSLGLLCWSLRQLLNNMRVIELLVTISAIIGLVLINAAEFMSANWTQEYLSKHCALIRSDSEMHVIRQLIAYVCLISKNIT